MQGRPHGREHGATTRPRGFTRRRAGWTPPTRRRCATWAKSIATTSATGTRRAKIFDEILDMPADPLSRAVALHGLGKMTIHDGEFKKGLRLMEDVGRGISARAGLPQPGGLLEFRRRSAKANDIRKQALALDPKDPYNIVFAAVFMAGNGSEGRSAEDRAREQQPAAGVVQPRRDPCADRTEGQGAGVAEAPLLRLRDATTPCASKEMMEARVDAMFDSIRSIPNS